MPDIQRQRNWLLAIVVLTWCFTVGRRLIVLPTGVAADHDFFISFLVSSLVACALSWVAASRGSRVNRRPWRWIAAAFTALLLPQPLAVIYAAQHGRVSDDMVLLVLLGRLIWAPLMLVGLLTFETRKLTGRQQIRFVADLATVVGGGFVITWYFQLGPALIAGPVGKTALTVLVLPTTDLMLIFGVCALLMRRGIPSWRHPLPVFLLGIVVYLLSDIMYAHQFLSTHMIWSTPLASLLITATLMMAAAATYQTPARSVDQAVPPRGRAVAYLPYGALLAGYTMLLVTTIRQDDLYPWGGVVAGVVLMTGAVVLRQVSTMRENHDLAVRDHLTGLANRVSLGAALDAAVRRHHLGASPSAMLVIDLDGFKKINDTHGHEAGDTLLVAFAEILKKTVRGTDVAARVGGDEFLVLLDQLPPATSSEQAMTVARRILDAAAQPIDIGGVKTPIRASIGVAMTDPDPDLDAATIRHRADMAMYTAKRGGRHRAELWSSALEGATTEQDLLEAALKTATTARQLRVHYQPIVTLATGQIIAAEALLRWEHPTRGLLFPDTFIPLAERTGAIEDMGLWILREAARQARAWQDDLGRALYISVNLSPLQLHQPDLVERIRHILDDTGFNPHDLVLELTETALVPEGSDVAVLEALRDLGIRIAVDDFGTGYSSLRYLTRLPVDILKLDRSFVSELNGTPKGSAVAEAVIRLAQAMDLDTVAEGIEIPSQATELTLLGYRTGQGYHHFRPMTAEAMTQLLHAPPASSEAPQEASDFGGR